jgi:hypothetical protein
MTQHAISAWRQLRWVHSSVPGNGTGESVLTDRPSLQRCRRWDRIVNDPLDEIERLLQEGERAVVATIVRTKGSTPREVGARMVIRSTGKTYGTVGGGCGEAEVWSEAMEVFQTREPRLIEVDLLHDQDAEGGRACGGLMYVFLEPLTFSPSG